MKSLFFCRDEYLLIMMLEKLQSFFSLQSLLSEQANQKT